MPKPKTLLTLAAVVVAVRLAEEVLANVSPNATINAFADMIIAPRGVSSEVGA